VCGLPWPEGKLTKKKERMNQELIGNGFHLGLCTRWDYKEKIERFLKSWFQWPEFVFFFQNMCQSQPRLVQLLFQEIILKLKAKCLRQARIHTISCFWIFVFKGRYHFSNIIEGLFNVFDYGMTTPRPFPTKDNCRTKKRNGVEICLKMGGKR
jgi:hypothetical protein